MDSLKSIYDKKNYQLILDLTNGTSDPEPLFYRASAFLALNKPDEAMDIFSKHRKELFTFNPLLTLKNNFEIRILLSEFDEAYEDYDEFKNYPYVSQAVEERLASLPQYLRSKERESLSAKPLSVEKAKEILKEKKDAYEVLLTLEAISKVAVDPFLEEIKDILKSSLHPSVKTYALLLLINCKYDEEVTFTQGNNEYHLIPKNTIPPFAGNEYHRFKEELNEIAKDPSISKVAYSLFSDYTLAIFPLNPFKENDFSLLELVFLTLAKDYLHSVASFLDDFPLINEMAMNKKKQEISAIISSIPPLL